MCVKLKHISNEQWFYTQVTYGNHKKHSITLFEQT